MAYEEQRTHPEDLAAQRRYHRVLLLRRTRQPGCWTTARRLIALLLRRDLAPRRSRSLQGSATRDAAFVLEDGAQTLALARAQWRRRRRPKAALALLSGFDKRFRGHAAIPEVYELAARVLVQGLQRTDMAQPILQTLEARYPDSEQTAEVRWLLRDTCRRPEAGSGLLQHAA